MLTIHFYEFMANTKSKRVNKDIKVYRSILSTNLYVFYKYVCKKNVLEPINWSISSMWSALCNNKALIEISKTFQRKYSKQRFNNKRAYYPHYFPRKALLIKIQSYTVAQFT